MVVDDDEMVRNSFRRGFVGQGRSVVTATSVKEARSLASDSKPDLAVVDLMINREWGMSFVRELRSLCPETAIVVVSGYMGIAAAAEAMEAGATYVFAKPVTAAAILERIEHGTPSTSSEPRLPSLARVSWEHVLRALADAGGNKSEAARRLGIHRQSLQAMLKKPPED